MSDGPYARRLGSRPSRTVWCCTCDRELTADDIGPLNHLTANPSHRVVEAIGEFFVWEQT